ncbi:MAG: helix-turn-helix domain-containing protein [Syntrophorhabdaceae bacterium]|nr:helix-turn-helix domain-containing protein [Syntrophorhabdaceae bacterium]
MDKLFTIIETAQILKLSRTKIFGLIKDGRLRPVKIDKRTLFKESELNRFIKSLNGPAKK